MALVTDRNVAVLNDTYEGARGTEVLTDDVKRIWTLQASIDGALPNFRESEPYISHPAVLEAGATAFADSTTAIGADNRCNAMTIARSDAGYYMNVSLVGAREHIIELWVKGGSQDSFNIAFVDNDASIDLDAFKWDWVADTFTKSAEPTFSSQPDSYTLITKGDMGEAGHYLKVRIKDPDVVDRNNARFRIFTSSTFDGHVAGASSYDISYKITPLASEIELQTIATDPAPADTGTRYHLNYAIDGDFTLPSYIGMTQGARLEILNTFGRKITIKPEPGERINGDIDKWILADGIHQTWNIEFAGSTWHVTPQNIPINNRVLIAESPSKTSGQGSEDLVITDGRTVADAFDEFDYIEFVWGFNTGSVWGSNIGETISRFSTKRMALTGTSSLFENQAGSDYLRCLHVLTESVFKFRVTGGMTYQHMEVYGINGQDMVAPGTMLTQKMGYAEWIADGSGVHQTLVAGVPVQFGLIAPTLVNDNNSGITFDGTTWSLPAGTWRCQAIGYAAANNVQPRFRFHDGTDYIGSGGSAMGGNTGGGGSGPAMATVVGPINITLYGHVATSGQLGSGLALPSSVSFHPIASHNAIRAEDAKVYDYPAANDMNGQMYNVNGRYKGKQVWRAVVEWDGIAHGSTLGILTGCSEIIEWNSRHSNAFTLGLTESTHSGSPSASSYVGLFIRHDGQIGFNNVGGSTYTSGRAVILYTKD